MESSGRDRSCHIINNEDHDLYPISGDDLDLYLISGGDRVLFPISKGDQTGRSRREKAKIAFTFLKKKIATTPILKHFYPVRPPAIVYNASTWAVSAALLQKYEGLYWPITFPIRTLNLNEVKYGMVEK